MLKFSPALIGAALLATGANAQSNEDKYNQKLEKEFVSHIDWVTSLETAQADAEESGKLIFGYFTRSYSP